MSASSLDRIVFVLVEPLYPGNVGATARALANFGMSRLVLVAPPAYDVERARWMAPGAHDVVEGARIVGSLDEALRDVHRVVATTARHRRHRQPVRSPRELAPELVAPGDRVTAILFGREDHGLPQAATERAEVLLRIPTAEHASLNLSQAALLVAAELFAAASADEGVATGRVVGGSHGARTTVDLQRPDHRDGPADLTAMEPLIAQWTDLAARVGYLRGVAPDKVRTTTRSLLQRAAPTRREVDGLRGLIRRVGWALDHPELDARRGRSSESTD